MVGRVSILNEALQFVNTHAKEGDGYAQNLAERLREETAKDLQYIAKAEKLARLQPVGNVPLEALLNSAHVGYAPLQDAGSTEAPDLPRQALLKEALQITSHDRNKAYGNPEDNFENIAAYWRVYYKQRFKTHLDITPQDVAHCMILMKMARLATNCAHRDSLVDIAGYAACGADCQAKNHG